MQSFSMSAHQCAATWQSQGDDRLNKADVTERSIDNQSHAQRTAERPSISSAMPLRQALRARLPSGGSCRIKPCFTATKSEADSTAHLLDDESRFEQAAHTRDVHFKLVVTRLVRSGPHRVAVSAQEHLSHQCPVLNMK